MLGIILSMTLRLIHIKPVPPSKTSTSPFWTVSLPDLRCASSLNLKFKT